MNVVVVVAAAAAVVTHCINVQPRVKEALIPLFGGKFLSGIVSIRKEV